MLLTPSRTFCLHSILECNRCGVEIELARLNACFEFINQQRNLNEEISTCMFSNNLFLNFLWEDHLLGQFGCRSSLTDLFSKPNFFQVSFRLQKQSYVCIEKVNKTIIFSFLKRCRIQPQSRMSRASVFLQNIETVMV